VESQSRAAGEVNAGLRMAGCGASSGPGLAPRVWPDVA
jgi:hypothetical protein